MQITPAQISESIVKTTVNQALSRADQRDAAGDSEPHESFQHHQDPRLDLYKSERASRPLEDVIETMRNRDIRIQIDSRAGRRRRRVGVLDFFRLSGPGEGAGHRPDPDHEI